MIDKIWSICSLRCERRLLDFNFNFTLSRAQNWDVEKDIEERNPVLDEEERKERKEAQVQRVLAALGAIELDKGNLGRMRNMAEEVCIVSSRKPW